MIHLLLLPDLKNGLEKHLDEIRRLKVKCLTHIIDNYIFLLGYLYDKSDCSFNKDILNYNIMSQITNPIHNVKEINFPNLTVVVFIFSEEEHKVNVWRRENIRNLEKIEIQSSDASFCDVGFSCGFFFRFMALKGWRNLIGIEKDENRVKTTELELERSILSINEELSFKLHLCDLDYHPIPVKDHSIDLILFSEVIEHLNNPLKALVELKRIIKPSGFLLVSTPNKTSVIGKLARKIVINLQKGDFDNESHPNEMNKTTLERYLSVTGFEIEKSYFFGLSKLSFLEYTFGISVLIRSIIQIPFFRNFLGTNIYIIAKPSIKSDRRTKD